MIVGNLCRKCVIGHERFLLRIGKRLIHLKLTLVEGLCISTGDGSGCGCSASGLTLGHFLVGLLGFFRDLGVMLGTGKRFNTDKRLRIGRERLVRDLLHRLEPVDELFHHNSHFDSFVC